MMSAPDPQQCSRLLAFGPTKVSSSAAKVVEIHEAYSDGKAAGMRRVEDLKLGKGTTVQFKPAGFHLMFIGITKPLKVGESVDFTLHFKDGSEFPVNAELKLFEVKSEAKGDSQHDHHNHH